MNRWYVYTIGCIWMGLQACSSAETTQQTAPAADTPHSKLADTVSQSVTTLTEKPGERMQLEGDFNGDGKKETLLEHYESRLTHKDMNKIYEGIDYDSVVNIIISRKPRLYLTCSDGSIAPFPVSETDQLFGFHWLVNTGDLNGDGTDEVAYIVDWADYSQVNTCHIARYTQGAWKKIASFGVREWQLEEGQNLITPLDSNRIRVHTFDDEAMEVEKVIQL